MSDISGLNSRPVSWISVTAVFGCFALFLALVYFVYLPRQNGTAQAPENIPQDQLWKTTAEGRKSYLIELRDKQQHQLANHAWLDQAKGVVQLPIDRAMELTVQEINARKR